MINANIDTAAATAAPVAVLIERKPLIEALAYVEKHATCAKSTAPIIGAITIEPLGDGVCVYGFDLDLSATLTLPGAWEAPGAFVADAKAMLAAVRACDGDTVRIESGEGVVVVSGDAMASRVPAMNREDVPSHLPIPSHDEPGTLSIDAAQLAHDWKRASVSISNEETRYYLNGIYMHPVPNGKASPVSLAFVSTDGHRMTRVTRPLPAIEGRTFAGVIMPRAFIAATLALLGKKPEGAATLVITKGRVRLSYGNATLDSKLIDGTFPDYTRAIPAAENVPLHATFEPGELGKVTGAFAKAQGKHAGAVKVSLSQDGATFTAKSKDDGALSGGAAVAWHDTKGAAAKGADAFAMGFNSKYLADIAGIFAGCGAMTLKIADANAPVRIESSEAPELTVVLMPMRVDGVSVAPSAKPAKAFEPKLTPFDLFQRDYRAAFAARARAAMRAAVDAYRETVNLTNPERMHDQIAMVAAQARRSHYLAESDQSRADKARAQERRAICRDKSLCRCGLAGSFRIMGQRYAQQVAYNAERDSLVAMLEGETRDVVPVELRSGKKVFLLRDALQDASRRYYMPANSNGGAPRSRRTPSVYIDDIARIVTPKARRASPAPAPVADTSALESTVAALIERVAAMESTIAAQASELASRAAVDEAPEPIVVAGDPVDTRDAYIASLLAEREALRERADAADARADAAEGERDAAIAALGAAQGRGKDARARTARRLLTARAGRRTAQREARGMQAGLAQAQGELARLAPIAAMVAAMAAPAPAPSGENVVAIRAA